MHVFSFSLSIDFHIVSWENSLCTVRSIWNLFSVLWLLLCLTRMKLMKSDLSWNFHSPLKTFLNSVKWTEHVYCLKVFSKRRKLLCLSYWLFQAPRLLTGWCIPCKLKRCTTNSNLFVLHYIKSRIFWIQKTKTNRQFHGNIQTETHSHCTF